MEAILDRCANMEQSLDIKTRITVKSQKRALQMLVGQLRMFIDPSTSRNEQATDALNNKRIEKVIKKLHKAYFPDEYPSSHRNFMGTNKRNKKEPAVTSVDSIDEEIVPVVFGMQKRKKTTSYGSEVAYE